MTSAAVVQTPLGNKLVRSFQYRSGEFTMDNRLNGLIIPPLVVKADDDRPARIFIEGNCFRSGIVQMFMMAGCIAAPSVEEADLVVFSGGADIDPSLYDQQCLPTTHFTKERDDECVRIFDTCIANDIPMFGICRGMQFLHAMAGGDLYQDVRNHGGHNHGVITNTYEMFQVSSIHHQMCCEDTLICLPLAHASESGKGAKYVSWSKTYGRSEKYTDKHKDLEAAAYPRIRAFAVQGHPELLNGSIARFVQWSVEHIDTLINGSFVLKSSTTKKEDGQMKPTTTESPIKAKPVVTA